ncbi:hypothetical protein Dimus_027272 [Dionaea muscipula]
MAEALLVVSSVEQQAAVDRGEWAGGLSVVCLFLLGDGHTEIETDSTVADQKIRRKFDKIKLQPELYSFDDCCCVVLRDRCTKRSRR